MLERIDEGAFCGSALKLIRIPLSVCVLGERSLSQCWSLVSLEFQNESILDRIEGSAFTASRFHSIILPSSVTFVDGSAFVGLENATISISHGRSRFRIRETFLELISERSIIRYFGRLGSIVIPSFICTLGKSSFCQCKSLTSVRFARDSQLERIEESAFSGSGIKSIMIPSSVSVLCKSSFSECKLLTLVLIAASSKLTRIEESSFSGANLKWIDIPASVEVLGQLCFSQPDLPLRSTEKQSMGIESINFANGSCLRTIGPSAFAGCRLKSVVIPASFQVVGKFWFHSLKALEVVQFESGSKLERIEESAFSSTGLKSITIPSSVAVLCRSCFSQCQSLESIQFESDSQ
jgi:hypothetical protein